MKTLTARQQQILTWIVAYRDEEDMPPTMMEIADEFDMTGNGAYNHVLAITKKGYLKRLRGRRGYVPTEQA